MLRTTSLTLVEWVNLCKVALRSPSFRIFCKASQKYYMQFNLRLTSKQLVSAWRAVHRG